MEKVYAIDEATRKQIVVLLEKVQDVITEAGNTLDELLQMTEDAPSEFYEFNRQCEEIVDPLYELWEFFRTEED